MPKGTGTEIDAPLKLTVALVSMLAVSVITPVTIPEARDLRVSALLLMYESIVLLPRAADNCIDIMSSFATTGTFPTLLAKPDYQSARSVPFL